MNYHSDYGQPVSRKRPRRSVDDIVNRVRVAAQRLVDDFVQIERWTQDWTNTHLNSALVDVAMRRCLTSLSATDCWGESNCMPSHELWRIAGRWLECGRLQYHARQKPHGYPGDFELLENIIDKKYCTHPLGRALDEFLLNQEAAVAVRNRTNLLATELRRVFWARGAERMHVVSIGSGPANDLCQFVESIDKDRRANIHLTLLDVDPKALNHARGKLERLLAANRVTTYRENLFRLSERCNSPVTTRSVDFLFCAGMFDYLTDESAAPMLKFLLQLIAVDGQLIVGNFGPTNPSRAYMEWIGNWYLIYRDAFSLLRLADAVGIVDGAAVVMSEPLGVNHFLRVSGGV